MITLYHGTDDDGYAGILADGFISSPAYLTPDKSVASDYANGGPVIAVSVDPETLCVDLDLPGGRLLIAADANDYLGSDHDGWTMDDYICSNYSVGSMTRIAA